MGEGEALEPKNNNGRNARVKSVTSHTSATNEPT